MIYMQFLVNIFTWVFNFILTYALMLGLEKVLGWFHVTIADHWYYLIGGIIFVLLFAPWQKRTKTQHNAGNNDMFPGL